MVEHSPKKIIASEEKKPTVALQCHVCHLYQQSPVPAVYDSVIIHLYDYTE